MHNRKIVLDQHIIVLYRNCVLFSYVTSLKQELN